MTEPQVKDVVIVGGGTAGWMAASALSKVIGKRINVTLVESEAIGTVGVGEATIPPIRSFNSMLGLNEKDFIQKTNGSIKLAIEFQNWGALGDSYLHGFGYIGRRLGITPFHAFYQRGVLEGTAGNLEHYSFNNLAARAGKFAMVDKIEGSPLEGLSHAFHFDAGLYARYLRAFSEPLGVKRVEGKIVKVHQHSEDGFVSGVELESGEKLKGDLFIDCSGFRGLLTEQTLETGYEDWTHWLPCDTALAVPSANEGAPLRPYTQSIAHTAGWQWRIPLQHRTGNGHVFCSDHMSVDEATSILMGNLEGEALKDPMTIRFKTGRRKKAWNKNVIALGLASGFLEPLESTSIHLIQVGLTNLLKQFPITGKETANVDEYNRRLKFDYETIRDFIILHYHANERTDSAFWNQCREMEIPETLQHRIDLYKQTGYMFRLDDELFTEEGWFQVMNGQRLKAASYNPMADGVSSADLQDYFKNLTAIIQGAVAKLPSHEEFLAKACPAEQM